MVVWKCGSACIYYVIFMCVFFVDFICIYAIFFVPLQSECTIQTVVSLIHKINFRFIPKIPRRYPEDRSMKRPSFQYFIYSLLACLLYAAIYGIIHLIRWVIDWGSTINIF